MIIVVDGMLSVGRQSIFKLRGCIPFLGTFSVAAIINSPSATRPLVFGKLVTLDRLAAMESSLSCQCCSFLSRGDIFLPNIRDEDGSNNDDGVVTTAEADVPSLQDFIVPPNEAWDRMLKNEPFGKDTTESRRVLMVDTHGHPHLQRDAQYADKYGATTFFDGLVVSLTCAVSPVDWKDALVYASQSSYILPALGVHPWYLSDIMISNLDTVQSTDDMTTFLNWDWLTELETQLYQHPHLLVGEIGLCKMARFVREFPKDKGGKNSALQLQRLVFRKQLDLAAKWSRPVTVHCVNAHGLFMEVMRDVLKEVQHSCIEKNGCWRKAFPPAIAMHSFTGTAHHVSEILEFEEQLLAPVDGFGTSDKKSKRTQKQQPDQSGIAEVGVMSDGRTYPLFYFGFSHSVNHLMCTSDKARKKGVEAVRSIPSDRLLVESDVHASDDVVLGTAGAIAYVAHARGERIEDVAETCARNGLRFLSSFDLAVNH
jgi:Tat protein secretion system quality control protein TatD with DNase activity